MLARYSGFFFLVLIWQSGTGNAAAPARKPRIEQKLEAILGALKTIQEILLKRPTTIVIPDPPKATGPFGTEPLYPGWFEKLWEPKRKPSKRKKKNKKSKKSKKSSKEIEEYVDSREIESRFNLNLNKNFADVWDSDDEEFG